MRGSYRSISVIRDGSSIADIDLYDFLIDGEIEAIQFRDGDTIVVNERGSSISVSGDVKNPALFELMNNTISGAAIQAMAMIAPDVNYVGISGVREARIESTYVPLEDFSTTELFDGDEVSFLADQHDQVIVVEVEGAHLGPSRFTVPPNTRLHELLGLYRGGQQSSRYGIRFTKETGYCPTTKDCAEREFRSTSISLSDRFIAN